MTTKRENKEPYWDQYRSDSNEATKRAISLTIAELAPLIKASENRMSVENLMAYANEIGCDDLNSEQIMNDFHHESTFSTNFDVSTNSLRQWVKNKMRTGETGEELHNMIVSEVDLQNRGGEQRNEHSNHLRSGLTPEKMKLVAPAILSKVLQSEELNRCIADVDANMKSAIEDIIENQSELGTLLYSNVQYANGTSSSFGQIPSSINMSSFNDTLNSASSGVEFGGTGTIWNRPSSVNTIGDTFSGGSIVHGPSSIPLLHGAGASRQLADQLNPYSTAEVKLEALHTLLATAQLTEVVGSATWPQIKSGLQGALLDITGDKIAQEEGMKLSTLALKVFVRLIGNTTENNGPFATREGFCGLIDFLVTLYQGDRSLLLYNPFLTNIGLSSDEAFMGGIVLRKKIQLALFRIFRALVQMCKRLPRLWNRFPRSYVEDMVLSMIKLVSINSTTTLQHKRSKFKPAKGTQDKRTSGNSLLLPWQMLALVDTKASWLRSWLHGYLGRNIFYSVSDRIQNNDAKVQLKSSNNTTVVSMAIDALLKELSDLSDEKGKTYTRKPLSPRRRQSKGTVLTKKEIDSQKSSKSLSTKQIAYSMFSYNLNSILLVMKFEQGRCMIDRINKALLPDGVGTNMPNTNLSQSSSNRVISRLIDYCLFRQLEPDVKSRDLQDEYQFHTYRSLLKDGIVQVTSKSSTAKFLFSDGSIVRKVLQPLRWACENDIISQVMKNAVGSSLERSDLVSLHLGNEKPQRRDDVKHEYDLFSVYVATDLVKQILTLDYDFVVNALFQLRDDERGSDAEYSSLDILLEFSNLFHSTFTLFADRIINENNGYQELELHPMVWNIFETLICINTKLGRFYELPYSQWYGRYIKSMTNHHAKLKSYLDDGSGLRTPTNSKSFDSLNGLPSSAKYPIEKEQHISSHVESDIWSEISLPNNSLSSPLSHEVKFTSQSPGTDSNASELIKVVEMLSGVLIATMNGTPRGFLSVSSAINYKGNNVYFPINKSSRHMRSLDTASVKERLLPFSRTSLLTSSCAKCLKPYSTENIVSNIDIQPRFDNMVEENNLDICSFCLVYVCLQAPEHYSPRLISSTSASFEDFQKYFCTKPNPSCGDESTLLSTLKRSTLRLSNPSTKTSTDKSSNEVELEALDDTEDSIDPEVAMETLLIIGFESIDNFVYLEKSVQFLELLNGYLDVREISHYRQTILGYPLINDANQDLLGSLCKEGVSTIPIPPTAATKEEIANFLVIGEMSLVKEILGSLIENTRNTNSVQNSMIPQTPFDSLSANKNVERLDILEKRNAKNAISLFAKTFLSGNSFDSVFRNRYFYFSKYMPL